MTNWEEELQHLKIRLAQMCQLAEGMLRDVQALLETRLPQAAQEIVERDRLVNEAELELERTCMRLLLRHQPFAKDFRDVSCILKIITDIERIADQARDIADAMRNLRSHTMDDMLREMGQLALKMVQDGIQSFLHEDMEQARRTALLDDRMDAMFTAMKRELAEAIAACPESADQGLELLMIGKYYERISDHAVNICEWTEMDAQGVHNKY